MHYSVFTAPIAMVLQKDEKQFSHPTIFWKYGYEYIIQDIHEKKQIRTTVMAEVLIRRNLWKSKPMSSKAVWWEPTCRENICGLVTKQKDKPSAVSLYLGCRTRYRLYAARWQLKDPKNSPKTKEDIVNGAKALQK